MTSTGRDYFDQMYDGDADPWGFESSAYEQRKYALTMASLPDPHYGSVFEPGCSIGVLTAMLAARCDRLVATDLVPAALNRARNRLAGQPHVTLEERAIPEDWPEATFDLVVLSEIAYYFDVATLTDIVGRLMATAVAGATVVAVHWRGVTNYPLTGDAAHRILAASTDLEPLSHHLEQDFVLDVWRRLP